MWTLAIFSIAAAVMIAAERARPGRAWPRIVGWRRRALLLNGLHLAAVVGLGLWLEPWLQSIRPWDASGLGLFGGALAGYLVSTFVYYWWHRARHVFEPLWRGLHQVHHSPNRLELITSFYKHPLEAATNVLFGGLILYFLVGLDPAQAALSALLNGLAELFYHWNVRTPRWLGFVIQRPESHCAHHELGGDCNYGDLPIWDMLFGTFYNPTRAAFDCGFGADEGRLAEMLAFRVVAEEDLGAPEGGGWTLPRGTRRAAALLALGLLQIAGDLSGSAEAAAVGMAWGASPAPKVFTTRDGLEGFSADFVVGWTGEDGAVHEVPLTPDIYARLDGPYNRRNVYGAALAGGSFLVDNPHTAPMYEAVAAYAFCGERTVLDALGVETHGPIWIQVVPRDGTETALPLTLEPPCR